MNLEVLNKDGKATGRTVDLPADIFGIEPNDHVIYLAVKQYLANQRLGTHKVKGRSEVHGSSKKLHKQKGTGGARKGNIRNPLYKGGGTVHGPQPRNYSFKLNKKVKDLARVSALSYKAKDNKILVVEDLNFETPKTKDFVATLKALNVVDKKVMYIVDDIKTENYMSARNVPYVQMVMLSDVNTYDVMNSNILVLTENAVKLFSETTDTVEA